MNSSWEHLWISSLLLLLLLLLLLKSSCSSASSSSSSSPAAAAQDLEEIEQHLTRLNRPPVKSIESPDGDIIDCILIQHQPALDHPQLRGSTIQAAPESRPLNRQRLQSFGLEQRSFQLWQKHGRCPTGTIPQRRTTAEDILRFGSAQNYGRKSHHRRHNSSFTPPRAPGFIISHEHAIAYVQGGRYYGARASINVWNPSVEATSEFSLSQVWILSGTFDGSIGNSIEAGWQVFPGMYGDQYPRLFIYWTSDSYRATGCYNLLCSGFIQTSNEIVIGGAISPSSSSDGSQYDISILIWKDPQQGNWWLEYGDQIVGYWPAFLFPELSSSAGVVEWGGEVVNTRPRGKHTSTMMGSGRYAEAGFARASYFRDLRVVNELNSLQLPGNLQTFAAHPNCYSIVRGVDKMWGSFFYYGGPGNSPNCP